MEYENKGSENYKTYLRIIVPSSSELSSVVIDGEEQKIIPAITDFKIYEKTNFRPPEGLEVDEENKNDKKLIGFIVDAPEGKKTRIKISLKNSEIMPSDGSFNYSLLYLKQPGTLPYPLTVTLQADEGFQSEGESAVIFDGEVKADKVMEQKVTRTRLN